MEVKDFSKGIAIAAIKNTNGKTFGRWTTVIGAISSALSGGLTLDYLGNPIYHLSGLMTYVPNRIIDYYSTYKLARLAEDSRFKDYELGKYFFESNPILPKHPSRKDLFTKKQVAIQISAGVASAIFPPAGYAFLTTTPFIYESNRTIKKYIEKSLDIGDVVKRMIDSNLSKEGINEYLALQLNKEKRQHRI